MRCMQWTSCWNHIFRRNCRGRFSSKTGRSVIIKAEYLSLFRFSSKKTGPMIWLSIMPHQIRCKSVASRLIRAALNAVSQQSKYDPINYPPRSPDLTVLDYYFWGRIKDLVITTTRDNMIRRISKAIRSLRAEEILRIINCFQNRVDACIAESGVYFEHLVA